MRPLYAQIDQAALRHNLAVLSGYAGNAAVMAVVKADAYGHGVGNVLPALGQAPQLAVACIEEALALRTLGAMQPIVLLEGIFDHEEVALCARENLVPVVHEKCQLEWLRHSPDCHLRAWIKIDTGMHRLGFQPQDLGDIVVLAEQIRHVDWQGVMTHFACADEDNLDHTRMQLQHFDRLVLPAGWQRCTANSAGLLRLDAARSDWVRPGLALYGISPVAGTTGADYGLRPVMHLRSRVLAVRQLQTGESAGYGQGFVASSAGRLATIALGYGDGFARAIKSGVVMVHIAGKPYPLVGRIAMDMALVWVGNDDVRTGDDVLLWGAGYPVERVADAAQTIPYTLTTMLTTRVRREVVQG